jgi:hypothetical protein
LVQIFNLFNVLDVAIPPPPKKKKKQIAGSRHGTSPIFNISSSTPARKTGADDFLNSENDKHDYDW